jgi:hypothetical protein
VLNGTFSNISTILWQPVLVIEEAGVPGKNHRPWAGNLSTVSLAAESRGHPFCIIDPVLYILDDDLSIYILSVVKERISFINHLKAVLNIHSSSKVSKGPGGSMS